MSEQSHSPTNADEVQWTSSGDITITSDGETESQSLYSNGFNMLKVYVDFNVFHGDDDITGQITQDLLNASVSLINYMDEGEVYPFVPTPTIRDPSPELSPWRQGFATTSRENEFTARPGVAKNTEINVGVGKSRVIKYLLYKGDIKTSHPKIGVKIVSTSGAVNYSSYAGGDNSSLTIDLWEGITFKPEQFTVKAASMSPMPNGASDISTQLPPPRCAKSDKLLAPDKLYHNIG